MYGNVLDSFESLFPFGMFGRVFIWLTLVTPNSLYPNIVKQARRA